MIRVASQTPRYHVGQLVCHRQYGYRGVVVAIDARCRAGDDWYLRNRTQPQRNQPWYHVLVDSSDQVTYAAEASLEADDDPREVKHPLVAEFFGEFDGTHYERNEKPWYGW